jgi:hypothetical protein
VIGPDDLDAMRPECPMPPAPDLPRLLEAAAGRLWGEKLPPDSAVERMVAEVERLRLALRIIAGREQCIDNLMGNADIARAALRGGE